MVILDNYPKQNLKVDFEVISNNVHISIGNGKPDYKVFLMNRKGSKIDFVFTSKSFVIKSLNKGKWSIGIRDNSDKYFFSEVVID